MSDDDQKLIIFLTALTRLCHATGFGIAGNPEVYVIEQDDYHRRFSIDDNSKLAFC
ncbi:hypothetical protein [Aurantiacibacter gangjinensis]|uniref:hypothetical protein n=1 Tax=Aurantiacibacter gangjinensis TaxID=502682 RepID=UPI000B31CE0A|nr:hypothetical protein [Aurantiacibacter gangjinensis]